MNNDVDMGMYTLRNKQPVHVRDVLEWGAWMEQIGERRVASSYIKLREWRRPKRGGYRKPAKHFSVRVSTVFLGIDHGWNGRPVLFETCIFDETTKRRRGERFLEYYERAKGELSIRPDFEQQLTRYHTWEEAVEGHKKIVEKLKRVHGK